MLTIKDNQIDIENKNLICNIEYPTIQNILNNNLITYINKTIKEDILAFKQVNIDNYLENKHNLLILANYEITLNKKNLISIPIVFSESEKYSRLINYINTYNYDINRNKKIELSDIFKNKFNYTSYINNLIEKQTDIPFRGVLPDQNFYITANSIVICFSSYELDNLYSGIQEFEIKFKEIEENLSEYTKTQIMED